MGSRCLPKGVLGAEHPRCSLICGQANHLGMPSVDAHERDLCNFVEVRNELGTAADATL